MSAAVSPIPRLTFFANDGSPLAGGNVYTYAAGTTTPKATYSNEALSTPISNPIVLNAAGRPVASGTDPTEVNVYLLAAAYKFVVKDSNGSTIYTADNIEAVSPNPPAVTTIALPATVTGMTSGGIIYGVSSAQIASSGGLTAHGVVVGGGAGTAPTSTGAGTTGQVLTSNGASADPSFQTLATTGTWTPVLGGAGGTSGQTYVTQAGIYVQVGKMITVEFDIALAVKGTITGNLQIQGLPATAGGSGSVGATNSLAWFAFSSSIIALMGQVGAGGTLASLLGITAAGTGNVNSPLTTSDIGNGSIVRGSLTYQTT